MTATGTTLTAQLKFARINRIVHHASIEAVARKGGMQEATALQPQEIAT
ncbi:MAG: hypothetical protein JJU08_12290 [Rhodobacteraceae bacterium]|nr:hypothetical protein [Paracoccaceae bacterium]